jgi:glycosyltransferase involved in cell wall biosynthesis
MQGLEIFVTADPELPVPPAYYGGIERVVAQLVDGLVGRGHAVTLFAHPDSKVSGVLVPWAGRQRRAAQTTWRNARQLATACSRRRPDVIQSFSRLAFLAPLLPNPTPKVMSYQRAITPGRIRWSHRLARGSLSFTGCSGQLIEPVRHLGAWRVIYNGVPVERFECADTVAGDAPLVFLGRIEEIKGPHLAIDVARKAGRSLVLAGNVPDEHQGFFDTKVKPHIDGMKVKYLGPVDDVEKSSLLASAAALLMPILWNEPFGIVMAEALACGTPVIGLSRGAVPEVIQDGVTGAVCRTPDEMVEAAQRPHVFDRMACRRDAENRFSTAALVGAYEDLYADVLHRGTARARGERRATQRTQG